MCTRLLVRPRAARSGAVGLVLLLAAAAAAEAVVPEPPRIGRAMPDFAATSLRGEPVSLKAALAGRKAVVVLFLSTVCPYAN